MMANIINFSDYEQTIETHFEFRNNQRSRHGRYISTCRHFRFEINEGRREVVCKGCGEVVDPFDIMIQFAEDERRHAITLAKNRAALKEFEKIQSEWSLTIKEKRRIRQVMDKTYGPKED